MKINLHNHSNYSDGLFSVEAILHNADRLGIGMVSITDHNEIRGSLEALKAASSYKVIVIPGIELFFWYMGKITELLVYFRKSDEILGFYNEFLSNKFIPTVKKPEELAVLVKKYNGMAIMPHPLAHKGCLRNKFDYPTINLEEKNTMTIDAKGSVNSKCFGGADLHLYKNSMKCFTEVVGNPTVDDLFNGNFESKAVDNCRMSPLKRNFQRTMITPLDIKYLTLQLVRKKIFNKGFIKPYI